MDKRTGWLKELKVGDLVIITSSRVNDRVDVVTKITPTGRINVGGTQFNSNGRYGDTWHYNYLKEATQEEVDKINLRNEKLKLIHFIEKTNIRKMSLEKLNAIKNIIEVGD